MQNENTLIQAGFVHYPEWDFPDGHKNYRLDIKGKSIRAHVWDSSTGFANEKAFVSVGIVVKEKGIVDRWRDICSDGSLSRFLNAL